MLNVQPKAVPALVIWYLRFDEDRQFRFGRKDIPGRKDFHVPPGQGPGVLPVYLAPVAVERKTCGWAFRRFRCRKIRHSKRAMLLPKKPLYSCISTITM